MPSRLCLSDHTAFHRHVWRLSLAGAALSFIFYLAGMVFSLEGGFSQLLLWALTAAVLGLAALPPQAKKVGPVLLALVVGLLGALGRLALASPPSYPWFGTAALGLAMGLIAGRDLKDFRRFVLPLTAALTFSLAVYVVGVFRLQLDLTTYMPPLLAEASYGAVFGFLASVGLLVRQIELQQDPVKEAYEQVRGNLSGEMLDLTEQAVSLYARIGQVLKDRQQQGAQTEPKLAEAVESLALKIIHLGPRWHQVEREAGQANPEAMSQRLETLSKKVEEAKDPVARRQYQLAQEALVSQLEYLQRISVSRERVISRVHNYLATMERLHLALINHRGVDAAKLSDEVQPILDEIESIGHEMDWASEAISEVAEVSEGTDATSSAGVTAAAVETSSSQSSSPAEQSSADQGDTPADKTLAPDSATSPA